MAEISGRDSSLSRSYGSPSGLIGSMGDWNSGRGASQYSAIQQGNWLDNLYLSLAPAATWTMPAVQWKPCDRFMNAYVVINCDNFSGAGTLTVGVETAPLLSMSAAAWQTAGSVNVAATGLQVIKIVRTSAVPIMGLIRVKVTCNTNAVTATVRADLLLKEVVDAKIIEWQQATFISFSGGGALIMPADVWLNMDGFLNLWLLCDFTVASGAGGNLTLKLQTSPAYTMDANGWKDVGATLTLGSTPQVYDARTSVAHAPQGIIRLAYIASGAVSGVLRVQGLFKDR